MKYQKLIFSIILSLAITSCDVVKPLFLINHGESKTVNIYFNTAGSLIDSDTLI